MTPGPPGTPAPAPAPSPPADGATAGVADMADAGVELPLLAAPTRIDKYHVSHDTVPDAVVGK